jgi:hypothetical protein
MKPVLVISIILFVAAVSLLSAAALMGLIEKRPSNKSDMDLSQGLDLPAAEVPSGRLPEPAEAPDTDDIDKEVVTEIEIYLDGDRDNGIFLGKADFPLESQGPSSALGQAGFELTWQNTKHDLEPGSLHHLYVYAYVPLYGWQYTKKEVSIPGQEQANEDIFLYIDSPRQGETVMAAFDIEGWSANRRVFEGPAISHIEIYHDGPKGFGRHIGNASLGIQRPDVVEVLGNPNYLGSGYKFSFDASLS